MAEVNKTASAPPGTAGTRAGAGFELRLERGGASVRLAGQPVAPGVRLEALTLAVPDVKFPFDVGAGAGQFKSRLCDLADLSIELDPSAAAAALAASGPAALGIEDVTLAFRPGFAEIAGRLSGGPAFTLRAGLVAEGERGLQLVFHSPRIYGPAPIPAGALPHLARAAVQAIGEEAAPREPLGPLLRRILAPRGWKLPRAGAVRLVRATVDEGLVRLAWDRAAGEPVQVSADPDLHAAVEGAKAFPGPEALLARGEHAAAREAWLSAGPAAAGHPFAADRLLSLLVQDDRFHDEALDLAAGWLARRPGFPPALAAEAQVRLARGEAGRAARALAALAAGAAERGEVFSALAAAEAVVALPGADREDALRAAETALAVRRDHVPALRALRALAAAAGDREALLRANRRLVAYDTDEAGKARAHAELGELLLEADPPAARLHLDQALRLAPDDPEALAALARACGAAGEPLRAARVLDRLRDLHLARGERTAAAAAAVESGALWEAKLGHAENALLRYREACELAPSADAHARAARAAEAAGQWAEASDHHAAVLGRLDRTAPGAGELALRTRLALAEVAERRLADLAGAAVHLEEAARLAPARADLLERLAALHRALGRTDGLAAALDRLAPLLADRPARAAALAEAGAAALALGRPGDALRRFAAALAADETSRPALLGLADLAAARGDAAAERDALSRLVPLAADPGETADLQDRLAAALERAGDLAGAATAAEAARAARPTPARLEAALRRARSAGEPLPLAALLAETARAAAAAGDTQAAAEAWLERARVLEPQDPAGAHAALAEARAAAPGDPAVLRAQAALAERTGESRLALGALRALLAGAPADRPALHLRAARAALEAGEPGAAREHAERAVAANAPGAGELLEGILERSGDEAGRAALFGRLGRHLEAAALHERAGDRALAHAALERAADDPASAAAALPRLAALREGDGDAPGAARALLALARLGQGRAAAEVALRAYDLAADPAALDLAAAQDPTFAPARARRALARAAAGADARETLADAEAALAGDGLAPQDRPALLAAAARAAEACGDRAALRRHLAALAARRAGAADDADDADDAILARLAAEERAAGDRVALARTLERRLPRAAGKEGAAVRAELAALLAEAEPRRAVALAEEALAVDPAALPALRIALGAGGDPARRAERLERLAAHPDAAPAEIASALLERARAIAGGGDEAAALAALRAAAGRGELDDELLERHAALAARAGAPGEAARALLARAGRARDRGEPGAADRLAEAGLAALAAGLPAGEGALAEALPLGPERETARAAREALAALARDRGDGAGERAQLLPLVPLLPTGARPAALLRAAALALAAGEPAAARASAEEARNLAPRDPAAVEACRAAAEAEGDRAAVAELLGLLATLEPEPAEAGPRLLARARLLEALGRAEEADRAFAEALAALPPDRSLAEAHALFRRATGRPGPSEPLERYALRAPGADAPRALRAAAALALGADEPGPALRCARRAFARTQDEPAFAGPLLARILYLRGSAAEALVVHRRLAEAGLPGLPPEEQAALLSQLGELAEEAGERDLALEALRKLLALRPHDAGAALRRFSLDPDRRRAVAELALVADESRSVRLRVELLSRAAEAALAEAGDRELSEALFRRARDEAAPFPSRAAEVAHRRAAALLAAEGERSEAATEALRDEAAAAQAAADPGGARAALERAVALAEARGRAADAARDLLQLEALAVAEGEWTRAAGYAFRAGAAQRDAGDLEAAEETLRRAVAMAPEDAAGSALLDAVAREREDRLLERLTAENDHAGRAALLARRAGDHPEDAALARAAADALLAAGQGEEAIPHLSRALAADPDDEGLAGALAQALASRPLERAELFLARAERVSGEQRAARLREAALGFLEAGEGPRATAAVREAFDAWPADGAAFAAALRDAGRDPERLDAVHAARARAVPAEAARCHRARAEALAAAGLAERAIAAYEAAVVASADEPAGAEALEALAGLAACLAEARGDGAALELDARLVEAADRDPQALPGPVEAQSRYRLGLAAFHAGRPADGTGHLERALAQDPSDPRAGIAWTALAQGYADRGDGAAALGAARARADRAAELGLAEERRLALEAAAELAAWLGDAGRDAAELLEALVAERAAAGEPAEALAPLARRAAAALEAAGEPRRARVALARAGLVAMAAPRAPAEEAAAPGPAPGAAPGGADPMELARLAAERAISAEEPAVRAAAFAESAEQLARAGADPEEVRAALTLACDADPDAPAPWAARARIEAALGDRLAAARAHLSAAIRSEGEEAAAAALEAARLFEEAGRAADAARAYRAAENARPGALPDVGWAALQAADPEDALALARASADALGREAAEAADPAVSASTWVTLAGVLADRLDDRASAMAALRAALFRARGANTPEGQRAEAAAAEGLAALGAPLAPDALDAQPPEPVPEPAAEPFPEFFPEPSPESFLAEVFPGSLPEPEPELVPLDAFEELAEAAPAATDPSSVRPEPFDSAASGGSAQGSLREAALPVRPERGEDAPASERSRRAATPSPTAAAEPPLDLAERGREHMRAGDWQDAYEALSAALSQEPTDLTLARDLGRVAERLGLYDEYVQLGEVTADAIAAYDPLAAAARYRHFAEVILTKLERPQRAAVMLEKALALVPSDPDARRELVELWSADPTTAPRAIGAWTEIASRDPADMGALRALAALCARFAGEAPAGAAPRVAERGRLAASLAAFAGRVQVEAPPPRLAPRVPAEVRARVAAPGATGPLARLLALLAPWLEPLFPADLARRGVSPADRTEAPAALRAALAAATAALGGRPHAAFATARPGIELALENTQPPAVVAGPEVETLGDAARAFLAARTVDLLAHGFALAGKFAPRDVGILLELACRFAGGTPPSLGLPAERAGAFLAALEVAVPADARRSAKQLAEDAAAELGGLDPRAFAAALRRTANRVALLYAGDPGQALSVLARLDRRLEAGPAAPADALALPDLRDLALFALSEPFLDLRLQVLG